MLHNHDSSRMSRRKAMLSECCLCKDFDKGFFSFTETCVTQQVWTYAKWLLIRHLF